MPRRLRALGWLHRGLGVFAALFVVVLASTGILLNHTDDLHLKQRPLNNVWLARYYGIAPPSLHAAYAAGEHWISQLGDQILLDTRPLPLPATTALLGAWSINDMLVIATREQLTLVTFDGALIDALPYPPSAPIRRAGTAAAAVVVELESGEQLETDADFAAWRQRESSTHRPTWARANEPPVALRQTLEHEYRGAGVTLERVLLDLHSGRLFGRWGVLLFDVVALIIIALAFSGVGLTWLRRWRQRSVTVKPE
ncbi:MAG: PepSY domain-containing protein [Thiotrichales bacterium]